MKRFAILLVFFQVLLFVVRASINLTYILKREPDKIQPSCIAEELERYTAVGWVYPIPASEDKLPKITTKYIPKINSDYNCNFSKNDKCNQRWALRDWQIDDNSTKTREFIADGRWEDLTTILISNNTKEFEHRYDIEAAQSNGFSVRSWGPVEIFLCSGWNPRSYPCYYFHMSRRTVYLSKFHMLDNETDYSTTKLKSYEAFSNIISDDEWRSFEVSVDQTGKIILTDKNLDRVVIEYVDSEPLKPMYLLMRSQNSSLWRISESHFMFTRTSQISRLGPQLHTTYKDLCISMYVATCSNCEMSFFYLNGTARHILKYVGPTDEKWMEVKLKQENIGISKFNIFVETKFIHEEKEKGEGWWAYDNVRVCNENEVKVSYLTLYETFAPDDLTVDSISCQLVRKPNWRPIKLEYDEISDFPSVKTASNETWINLSWELEDPDKYLSYFIFYQGLDDCSTDIAKSIRFKSSGFISTKHNEVDIKDLVPFTKYYITISSVLHEHDKVVRVDTLETEEPAFDEQPIKIHIRPSSTAVNISWDKPDCNSQKGRLIYSLNVTSYDYNISKEQSQTGNSFTIDGLRPYSLHKLTVTTARNARMLNNGERTLTMEYNFTTLPGVAPSVDNLEVYAIGSSVAFLRYDLPLDSRGIPLAVQATRCNKLSFAKCRSYISSIERCTLWKNKYCLKLDYLLPKQAYIFKVSVKNQDTNVFGAEAALTEYSVEKVPAPPETVTYEIVECEELIDYCHLNVSWSHPYFPNGTIETFHIILNDTDTTVNEQPIQEVYKIFNNTYLPKYTHQVKYVPYGKTYNLSVQSANSKYKSNYTSIEVKTADLGKHIDQKPKLYVTGYESLLFKLPPVDRRLDGYKVTTVVQDFNNSVPVYTEDIKNKELYNKLCHPFGTTWVLDVVEVKGNKSSNLTVKGIDDIHSLKPDTQYCITFLITNNYHGKEHDVVYYEKLTIPSLPVQPPQVTPASSFNHLYMLFLMLMLVPIGFLLYRYIHKKSIKKRREQNRKENVYESLPFEDHDGNFVNNRNYDQLIHK